MQAWHCLGQFDRAGLLVDSAVLASTIKNTSKERERQTGYDTAN
jgi:hypothetical protein